MARRGGRKKHGWKREPLHSGRRAELSSFHLKQRTARRAALGKLTFFFFFFFFSAHHTHVACLPPHGEERASRPSSLGSEGCGDRDREQRRGRGREEGRRRQLGRPGGQPRRGRVGCSVPDDLRDKVRLAVPSCEADSDGVRRAVGSGDRLRGRIEGDGGTTVRSRNQWRHPLRGGSRAISGGIYACRRVSLNVHCFAKKAGATRHGVALTNCGSHVVCIRACAIGR
mmetsp:Transcript_41235/g.89034  ORF Transcript_41235/g.89034 Transcript_41235/m.89034 type:complete len:227 (-) Transcript_41235:322-1002(-)